MKIWDKNIVLTRGCEPPSFQLSSPNIHLQSLILPCFKPIYWEPERCHLNNSLAALSRAFLTNREGSHLQNLFNSFVIASFLEGAWSTLNNVGCRFQRSLISNLKLAFRYLFTTCTGEQGALKPANAFVMSAATGQKWHVKWLLIYFGIFDLSHHASNCTMIAYFVFLQDCPTYLDCSVSFFCPHAPMRFEKHQMNFAGVEFENWNALMPKFVALYSQILIFTTDLITTNSGHEKELSNEPLNIKLELARRYLEIILSFWCHKSKCNSTKTPSLVIVSLL